MMSFKLMILSKKKRTVHILLPEKKRLICWLTQKNKLRQCFPVHILFPSFGWYILNIQFCWQLQAFPPVEHQATYRANHLLNSSFSSLDRIDRIGWLSLWVRSWTTKIHPTSNLESTFNQPFCCHLIFWRTQKIPSFSEILPPTSFPWNLLNLTSTWPLGCKTWHFSHPTIAATWSTTWVASSIASVGVSAIDKWRLSSCSVAASFQYPLVTARLFATKKITEKLLLLLPLLARVFDVPYKYGKWATHNHHKFGCWWFLFALNKWLVGGFNPSEKY